MNRAAAYARKGKLLLHAYALTRDGIGIAAAPFLLLDATCDDDDLMRALLEVLAPSYDRVPNPTDWPSVSAPLLAAVGARSWSAFMRGTSCVELEGLGQEIRLTPMRNLGGARGFEAEAGCSRVLEAGPGVVRQLRQWLLG